MSKDSSEESISAESFPSGHRKNLVFIFGILLLICNEIHGLDLVHFSK